jgi:hypothetical protein
MAGNPMNIGQNNGFKIENWIIEEINNKKLSDIHPDLQQVITAIGYGITIDDSFTAFKKEGRGLTKKSDVTVLKNLGPFTRLSVKSGSGNSVHQENIHQFVAFLQEIGAKDEEIEALLFFHWGDGTQDGTASVSSRMTSHQIKIKHPEVISSVDALFERFKLQIVTRAMQGDVDGTEPQYLLYCNDSKAAQRFLMTSMSKVIAFHNGLPAESSTIQIGHLNFQNWNRCLSGQELISNKHRNDIQFKWGNMIRDMEKLSDV